MKGVCLTIGLAVLTSGCSESPRVPDTTKQDYPVLIRDSPDQRAKAEREWRKLLDFYKAPQTPADLYPIIYTPRSLLGVSGGIKIAGDASLQDDLARREAMKGFIERWRELLAADPPSLSLVSVDESAGMHRFTYRQASYPFAIAGGYGELVAVMSSDGRLVQLDDTLIPVVDVPVKPTADREAAAKRLVGRSFTYSDIAGREQQVTITALDEIAVKRLVVLPIEKRDGLELRVAWEIQAGRSLVWNVYVDAMTGDELKVAQNFRT